MMEHYHVIFAGHNNKELVDLSADSGVKLAQELGHRLRAAMDQIAALEEDADDVARLRRELDDANTAADDAKYDNNLLNAKLTALQDELEAPKK